MKYATIIITYSGNTPIYCSKGWGTIDAITLKSSNCGSKKLTYADAMRELRRLERRLHTVAELDVNQFNHNICTKQVWGWVEGT